MNPNWLMFIFGAAITWATMSYLYGWSGSLRADERLCRRIGTLDKP